MDSQLKRRGKPLHLQAREVVNNVYKYFAMEANMFKNTTDKNYFNKVHGRVSEATGVSQRTINRILNEADEFLEASPSPAKGRPKKTFCLDLDVNHYGFIRRLVYDFHLKLKKEINFEEMKKICAESIDYKGGCETIKKILEQMGFHHMHTEDYRKVLVEKFEVRLKRIKFLREIENYRSVHKNIVYMSVLKFAIPQPSRNRQQHLTVMVAGNEEGLVPGATAAFEYDVGANWSKWEKWLRKQLLPHLATETVLVVDSAPIHDKLVDPPPAPEASKQEMMAWLTAHEVSVEPGLKKPQLYEHILQNEDIYSEYLADQLLAPHGHRVLRLPPYHAEFNPVQTIYCQLRVYVAKQPDIQTVAAMKQFILAKLDGITREEWRKACERVVECEREFRVMERDIDEFTENLAIRTIGSDEESSEDTEGAPV